MKTFTQLFDESRGALDNGVYVRSKAPEIFRGTNLVLSEGLPAAPQRDGSLLGIGFYSLPDLQFLDDIVIQSRNSSHSRDVKVQIFDILIFKSMQDVANVFPGLAPAYSTPMIGVWANGQLVLKGWGLREAQRIARGLFT